MKKILITALILGSSALYAKQTTYTEYIDVTSSKAVYERVSNRVPYEECYEERVPVTYYNNRRSGLSGEALVGGIVGGVLGHQIGGGHGKDIATAGGAILGTLVGQNAARNDNRNYQSTRYEIRRHCETRYADSEGQRRLTGYKNIAYYKGKKIVKFSNRRLSTIAVRVTLSY